MWSYREQSRHYRTVVDALWSYILRLVQNVVCGTGECLTFKSLSDTPLRPTDVCFSQRTLDRLADSLDESDQRKVDTSAVQSSSAQRRSRGRFYADE